jgi:flavin reductase (DIM6/NTAB) family NADH-FMN oxidoreductase RutF
MTIDPGTFAEVMTSFPTGVAIVTSVDAHGNPVGLTSNAVASVSADPPSLLVCVSKTSRTLPALLQRKGFLVNFMAADSRSVCSLFASRAEAREKFESVSWVRSSRGDHPRLNADSVAFADCETSAELEAGTHLILIGRIIDGGVTDRSRGPIAYFKRDYRSWPADVSA